jgi:penicillin-binding protein 1C
MLREHLGATAGLGVGDAAVVIIESSTGAVRALVSVSNAGHRFINSALAPRSCGSILKPFLYLSAIDHRKLPAASLLPDTPDAIPEEYRDYDPQNYSKRHLGPVRVREALGNSLNVPAVFALSRNGARQTFEYFRTWGLNFPASFDAYGAGFILGNAPRASSKLRRIRDSRARRYLLGAETYGQGSCGEPSPCVDRSLRDHRGHPLRQPRTHGQFRSFVSAKPYRTHSRKDRDEFRIP